MKNLNWTLQKENLIIQDYPNSDKLAKIEGPEAKKLQGIVLHQWDLQLSLDFLNQINNTQNNLVRLGLWYAAISIFFKCFGNSQSRNKLIRDEVYQKQPEAFDAFNYFKALRDKHIIHDENPYSQSFVGVVINKPDAEYKIADVVSGPMISNTLDQGHFSPFFSLVKYALEWVSAQREELHNSLAKEYEKMSFEELNQLEIMTFKVPSSNEIKIRRT